MAESERERMMTRTLAFAGLFCLLPVLVMAADVPGAAPAPAEPSSTTATYGDWTVRCTQQQGGTGAPARSCEVVQGIQTANSRGLLAQLALGRVRADDPLHLVVQLPLGVWLPNGVTFYPDPQGGSGITAPFTICSQGCLANVALTPAMQGRLADAPGPGRIEFVDGARKTVVLPMSLNGLSSALQAKG
jgi:invasion protein IalB